MKQSIKIKASDIGSYVGRRLMTTWSANLLVYGAEESPDYEFEESFDGSFTDCLKKVEEYLNTITKYNLDAYVTLEADRNNDSYTFYDIEDLYDTFPDEFEDVEAATKIKTVKQEPEVKVFEISVDMVARPGISDEEVAQLASDIQDLINDRYDGTGWYRCAGAEYKKDITDMYERKYKKEMFL